MENKYGPGSEPELHEGVLSYSPPPVLSAHFIPTESVSPPLSVWVQMFEIRNRVYGQILTQRRMREFDELPQMVNVGATSLELEYESRDYHDPLRCLDEIVDGLESVAEQKDAVSVVLESVEVHGQHYVECGADLVQTFGTPFSDILGVLSRSDVLFTGSDFDTRDDGNGSDGLLDGL